MSAQPSIAKRVATASGVLAVLSGLVGAVSLLDVVAPVSRQTAQWRAVAVRVVREWGLTNPGVADGPWLLSFRPTALVVLAVLAAVAVWTDRQWLVWTLAVAATAVAGVGTASFGFYFALPALLLVLTGLCLSFAPVNEVAEQQDVTF